MRRFFASFFGSLAALVLVIGGFFSLLALLIAGLVTKQERTVAVTPGSYLVLDLSDQIQDAPLKSDGFEEFAEVFGEDRPHILQSRELTRALQAAATDDDIAGLYLSGQDPSLDGGTGFGALKEVRDAILAFRAAGKPVKAWLTFAGTREYYIASAADEISLDPFGTILLPGLATQPTFFAGTFEKFGIGVQVTRVGKFKSAVEPFTRRDMSPESRAQTQKLLDDIWGNLSSAIEETRKLPPGKLQALADTEGLIRPEDARAANLVDRVAYLDEVLDDLRTATGAEGSKESFKQISVASYAALIPGANLVAKRSGSDAASPKGHEKIAIVYAEGPIVDGTGKDQSVVWGDKLARDLREIRRDDSIKAVVLRVNSPGGSVTASEAIQREVRLVGEKKPLVVSMGSVAASGGYWISTYSQRIFAEPTTITGSIGVFGILFNVEKLATDTLGLTFETVKTGRFADAATVVRPKSPEELAIIQKSVDWIYQQFLSKVAESRKLDIHTVDEVAQGRVWSGTEAAKIGLVDEIGGLDAAIAFAAGKASIGEEFTVVEYPRRKLIFEALIAALENTRREKAQSGNLGAGFGGLLDQARQSAAMLEHFNDPRGLYARLPFEAALR